MAAKLSDAQWRALELMGGDAQGRVLCRPGRNDSVRPATLNVLEDLGLCRWDATTSDVVRGDCAYITEAGRSALAARASEGGDSDG